MLNGIHLVDFGNHRNTRLTFGPMTALVGQNGSGKTTVMRAVGEAGMAVLTAGHSAIAGNCVRRHQQVAILTASWRKANRGSLIDWGVRLGRDRNLMCRRVTQGESSPPWIPDPEPELEAELSDRERNARFDALRKYLSEIGPQDESTQGKEVDVIERPKWTDFPAWKSRYFKTSARSLQDPAIADQEEPAINDDGSNLAWALSYLMTAEPERFAAIVSALKKVVPVVRRIRSKPVKLTRFVKQTITINKQDRTFDEEREVMGQELIFDMKSGDNLPATAVSEGTLVVLAILTLVYGSDADLIMLDDVELGLHPKAQRDLIRQLRTIQKSHPRLQILVSTHSPYIVDEFKAEDVWVFAPDAEGCAVVKRLSEHPDAKRSLEVLTTGEFWSAEGEPWVLEGEPTARVAEEPGQ